MCECLEVAEKRHARGNQADKKERNYDGGNEPGHWSVSRSDKLEAPSISSCGDDQGDLLAFCEMLAASRNEEGQRRMTSLNRRSGCEGGADP